MENTKPQRCTFSHLLPLRRSSPDGQSFRSSVEEKPLKKNVMSSSNEDSDDDNYENVSEPHQVMSQIFSRHTEHLHNIPVISVTSFFCCKCF